MKSLLFLSIVVAATVAIDTSKHQEIHAELMAEIDDAEVDWTSPIYYL
jgi:hypothetical protein